MLMNQKEVQWTGCLILLFTMKQNYNSERKIVTHSQPCQHVAQYLLSAFSCYNYEVESPNRPTGHRNECYYKMFKLIVKESIL